MRRRCRFATRTFPRRGWFSVRARFRSRRDRAELSPSTIHPALTTPILARKYCRSFARASLPTFVADLEFPMMVERAEESHEVPVKGLIPPRDALSPRDACQVGTKSRLAVSCLAASSRGVASRQPRCSRSVNYAGRRWRTHAKRSFIYFLVSLGKRNGREWHGRRHTELSNARFNALETHSWRTLWMNVRRRFLFYLAKKEARKAARACSHSNEFFAIHFFATRLVDSYGECKNVVNSGEVTTRTSFGSVTSVVSSRRKIGEIRRIVGRRTCAARSPSFGVARQKVRKIRPRGKRRRVEFSPSRYISTRMPENSSEYGRENPSSSLAVHRRLILVALFSQPATLFLASTAALFPAEKFIGETLFATHTRAHTHTLDSIFTFTSAAR